MKEPLRYAIADVARFILQKIDKRFVGYNDPRLTWIIPHEPDIRERLSESFPQIDLAATRRLRYDEIT